MTNFVLWVGPVSSDILADSLPPGWTLHTVNEGLGGIGSGAFRAWAQSLGPDPLTTLLPTAERVILAGFSAGHGAHELFLQVASETRDRRVVGLLALDAYFEALGDVTPKPGHAAWLRWIIAQPLGRRAIITTGHTSDGSHLNGHDSFDPLGQELRLRPSRFPSWVPRMGQAMRRGGVTWLDFDPSSLTHTEHATVLGPAALPAMFNRRSNSSLGLFAGLFALFFLANHDRPK